MGSVSPASSESRDPPLPIYVRVCVCVSLSLSLSVSVSLSLSLSLFHKRRLNRAEMKKFAEMTGFEGRVWKQFH